MKPSNELITYWYLLSHKSWYMYYIKNIFSLKNDTRTCYILWCNFNKICLNSVEIERMSPPLAAISQAFSKTIDNGKMDGFGGMLLKNLNEVFEQVPCVKTSECTEITSIKLDGPCLIYFSNIIL